MRHRGIALSGLAMIVAGLIWAAVAWAATSVEITKPSGSSVDIAIREEDYDVDQRYKEGDEYVARQGRSLKSVLERVGIKDREWTSITVEGLTVDNGAFRPKKPPIFFLKDGDVRFYRPASGSEPFDTRTGTLDLFYRVPLQIEATDNTPKAGQTVTYEASVPGGGSQDAFKFTWTPSTGSSGTGPKFKYTYPESSGEVSINVTAKRESDNMNVGTATAATHEIEYTPPPSNSGSGTGGLGSGFGSSFDYTPSSPDYDYDFPDTGNSSPDMPDAPKLPDSGETPSLEDLGTSVEGELLSATTPLPPSSGDAGAVSPVEETPDPEEAIEEAEQINAPGALIAAGVVVGLIGLGAGREMENVRPRRIRRPGLSGLRRLSPPWK
ncbi:MAG: PKD domain-containing protein [Actinomycetota bacterium]|nr:PKD domain-containing protein [Actinomycetota bacterium]